MSECEFCHSILTNNTVLKTHLSTNKKCLKIRGLSLQTNFKCEGCHVIFTTIHVLKTHEKICKDFIIFSLKKEHLQQLEEIKEQNEKKIFDLQQNLIQSENTIEQFHKIIEKNRLDHDNYLTLKIQHDLLEKQHEKTIAKLEMKITQCDSFIQGIVKERFESFNNEAIIEIDNDIEENEEEYKLQPLDLGDNLYIENRDDGYINVTNLCKAGNKEFKAWNRTEKTQSFLKALSRSVNINTDLLIQSITGGKNEDRKTWVHPYVAINIAQWISPQFDVKMSSWIYEVMLTGKIDISKTKSFQQLRLENKEHKLKIQYLTKKYVKSQPRIQYNEKNVIYILTTPSHKKEGKYILGKATNLTNRLSTYNKTDEHEVIYYQECPDEDTMAMIEQVVFQRLKDYREQANRERFILPYGESINKFIDVIKKSIEFLK